MTHFRFLALATVFQGGLLLFGLGLARVWDVSLTWDLHLDGGIRGLTGAFPMLLVFWYAMRSTWAPLVELRKMLFQQFGPLIVRCSIPELIYISLLAGFSEEILFRGAIQNGLLHWGLPTAVIVANLLFGLCHAATKTYFLYATAAGLYLSWIAGFSPQNLSPAILTHSLYDFVALWIVRQRASHVLEAEPSEAETDKGSPDSPLSDMESPPPNL